jgi:transcription elongation GreA/GreB family factor
MPKLEKIDKNAIVRALHARLAEQLRSATESQQSAQSGATHPESRQEGSKDMRSTEQSYLARGLAERVETLRDAVRAVELLRVRELGDDDVAGPGALVALVDEDGEEHLYFLAPAGGGEKIVADGVGVLVLTPRSPLGAAISGRRAGESVSVELPSGLLRAEIDRVE